MEKELNNAIYSVCLEEKITDKPISSKFNKPIVVERILTINGKEVASEKLPGFMYKAGLLYEFIALANTFDKHCSHKLDRRSCNACDVRHNSKHPFGKRRVGFLYRINLIFKFVKFLFK